MIRRALRLVRGEHVVNRGDQGTVRYEIENLGRHLVEVLWDAGFVMDVFPGELQIIGGQDILLAGKKHYDSSP